MTEFVLNETAVKIATKLIKLSEGCVLRAYADPASPLAQAIIKAGKWQEYLAGKWSLPEGWEKLKATPWTIGYGDTQGVKQGDVWTQSQADERLDKRVRQFFQEVLNATPNLAKYSAEKQAAVVSLVYNLGITNYKKYDISKQVQAGNHETVVKKFRQYVYANGLISHGLQVRREREANLYASVAG